MRDIVERANLQASMVAKAFQDENLQDDPEALTAWAMQEMGIGPDEARMVETLAYKSLLIIKESINSNEHRLKPLDGHSVVSRQ